MLIVVDYGASNLRSVVRALREVGAPCRVSSEPKEVLERFLTQMPRRLKVAKRGPTLFNSVMVEIDEASGKARAIERVDREIEGDDA